MRTGLVLLLALLLALCADPCGAQPPALMLAKDYQPGIAIGDYWVSEKLDGVRGRWDGRRLWTRGGYPVDAPAWFTAGWPDVAMDGELWMGRGRFEETSTLVRNPPAAGSPCRPGSSPAGRRWRWMGNCGSRVGASTR